MIDLELCKSSNSIKIFNLDLQKYRSLKLLVKNDKISYKFYIQLMLAI